MTQVNETQEQIKTQMNCVKSNYNLSDLEYGNYQFELGMEFLKNFIFNDDLKREL